MTELPPISFDETKTLSRFFNEYGLVLTCIVKPSQQIGQMIGHGIAMTKKRARAIIVTITG